ncbi:MAG: peptidoglycan editing factor PgeF [Burkholderiaceae bacterium]
MRDDKRWLRPHWDGAGLCDTWMSTRQGGASLAAGYDDGMGGGGLNLGTQSLDDPQSVTENWRCLQAQVGRPVVSVQQIHGTDVRIVDAAIDVHAHRDALPLMLGQADALVSTRSDLALVILCADCLPVMITDAQGGAIGIAHAGWRGLAGGVIENTVAAMRALLPSDASLLAWVGPGIGPLHFEVGDEVRQAFLARDGSAQRAFVAGRQAGKWYADLPALALRRLRSAGVSRVAMSGLCTFSNRERFYSHRREAPTGRMAAVISRLQASARRP